MKITGDKMLKKSAWVVLVFLLAISVVLPGCANLTVPIAGRVDITVGTPVSGTTPDYATPQLALDALPASGGKIVVLGENFTSASAISRAINNVTIQGVGRATYLARNGTDPVISAGSQSGWVFQDLAVDAGGIDIASATNWTMENVYIGTTYYAYRTSISTTNATSWQIPTGRGVSITVASSTAPNRGQADYVTDGADDQVQIQAAMDAASAAGGGRVQLSEGLFNLYRQPTVITWPGALGNGYFTLSVPSNITLEGQGSSTILRLANAQSDGGHTTAIITNEAQSDSLLTGNDNITIRNLTIDGNKDNQSGFGEWRGRYAPIIITGSRDTLIDNVNIHDGYAGAAMIIVGDPEDPSFTTLSERATISNSKITSSGIGAPIPSDAIFISGTDGLVVNNFISGVSDTGVAFDYVKGLRIINNRVDATLAQAFAGWYGGPRDIIIDSNSVNLTAPAYFVFIQELAEGTAPYNIIISNNKVYGAGVAVYALRGNWYTVTSNIIVNSTGEGVYFDTVSNSVISNNIIRTATASGIRLQNSSAHNVISSNYISDVDSAGITVSGSNYVSMTGNFIEDGGPGITVGSGSIFASIVGNNIKNAASQAIVIGSSNHFNITGNTIHGAGQSADDTYAGISISGNSVAGIISNNRVADSGSNHTKYGIELATSAQQNIVVTGNNLLNSGDTAYFSNAGSLNTVRSNYGWVTENSGTATMLINTGAIAVNHGLSATPTRVQVTMTSDPGLAVSTWADTYGASQFTVHTSSNVTAATTFDWRAVVGEGN